ncbi:aminotransferase class V-fold PLP-dependent enzyme [Saccharothrix obliqua]|uniref:aminotransferase class V-fold PLP-dependent enzyme n=1 Tax=Saccharothrix obliqua TaxID=2861747 RepID=UPI001C5E30FE|nr:aminotransferase class V-fold PLP-dependent enzyme [Saccharothrix obliqua]MBW4720516.1 aminotransferase class V-fold PLP-dependent enzyme [Saccharothrix obliqua]
MSSINRRHLLAGLGAATGLVVAGAPPAPALARDAEVVRRPDGAVDWAAVRRLFRTEPGWTNLAMFYISSHPTPVRRAIEHLARQVDADPLAVSHGLSLPDGPTGWDRVRSSLADYIGGRAEEIAMTASTSVGLGVVYNGLVVKPGQEFLLTEEDHTSQRTAARLAAAKFGASVRFTSLFRDVTTTTVREITERLAAEIRPTTRVVGTTWVQSSTGLRSPIAEIAAVVRAANEGRAPADRCLLVVDGVHGLAAIDADAARLGADVFVAGTHKWLFGPRGTGLVWVSPTAIDQFRPTFISFVGSAGAAALSPGGFLAYEHAFALPVAVALHQEIGRPAVAARIAELGDRARRGLRRIRRVRVHTPLAPELSAGITCFTVDGFTNQEVIDHAAHHHVRLSESTYSNTPPFVRIGTGVMNTPAEVDRALEVIAGLRR